MDTLYTAVADATGDGRNGHEVCPYSNATLGNIDVTLNVV